MELNFSHKLRQYRRERDMTQEELAQKIGISPQSVSKWERGCCCPDLLILDEVASALGVEVKDLFVFL